MLKNIDPVLDADALYVLRAMGHGDTLVIADANFPGEAIGRQSVYGRPVRLGCTTPQAVQAVLSLITVDTFEDNAFCTMSVVGSTDIPEVQREVAEFAEPQGIVVSSIERFAFYELAKSAFAIFVTQERRFYGNFAIRKGVIDPGT